MKYEYMKESEQMLQYFQFPKFLLKLSISQNAKFLYMILYDRARISRKMIIRSLQMIPIRELVGMISLFLMEQRSRKTRSYIKAYKFIRITERRNWIC